MNKSKLKKFLTLLVCLMLVASMTLLAACNKNNDTDGDTDKVTATPTFTNGNFTSFSSSDTYPKVPSSWTGSPTSDQSNTEFNYSFVVDDLVGGIISLNPEIYNEYKSKWGDLGIFEKYAPEDLAKDYTADDDVLMLYNKVNAYQTYTSAKFTASANSYYKLSVDVRTHILDGNNTRGATITLYDATNSVNVSTFTQVVSNDSWTRYTFYIKTKTTSSSLQLKLSLGNYEITKIISDSLTSGYAFFDNVQLETITADKDNNKTASEIFNGYTENLTEEAQEQKVDLSIPNGSFDFLNSVTASTSVPALYTRITDANTKNTYNRICLDAASYKSYMNSLGVTVADGDNGPGFAGGEATRHHFAYALNAGTSSTSPLGMRTSSPIVFKRGTAYKVSVWVNTEKVETGKTHISLASGKSEIATGDVSYDIDPGVAGWKQYTFIVLAGQNTNTELYFQMWLGYEGDNPEGYAFFDNLEISVIDLADKENGLKDWQAEFGITDKETINKTIAEGDSLIDNGYFQKDEAGKKVANDAGWTVMYDEGKTGVLNNVDNSGVIKKIADVREKALEDSAYTSISNFIMEVTTTTPTIYGLSYNVDTDPPTIKSLQAFTAYRFSVWVKTIDVQSTAGVTLNVYDGNKNETIATFANVNTTGISESESLNGYRELVCYIYTAETTENISFELMFGSGSQWTPTTLFDGTAYVCNASLTKVEYDEYNKASSSGTYTKKYNYNTTATGSFANDQFDKVDMDDTKGFDGTVNDGKVDGTFQNTTFGVPDSWTLTNDDSLKNASNTFSGIIDLKRANLIANLKAAAGTSKTYGGASLGSYDFDNLFFTPDTTSMSPADILKYSTYATGDTALMLAAADEAYSITKTENDTSVTKYKEFASMKYTTTDEVTLTADSYYEISVLVKTVGGSKASVYLTTDNSYETNGNAKFEGINNTESEVDTNGWRKYTFIVKVGFSAVDVQLVLCLGKSDSPATSDTAYTDPTGGIVFFDYVAKLASTEKAYNDEIAAGDTTTDVIALALDTDSFGSSKTASSSSYISPTSGTWTGTTVTSGENNKYGIVNDTYNFSEYAEDLKDVLVGHTGSSCLVINNTSEGAYYFTSAAKTFAKASYYKVSVWVKTWGVTEGNNAYVKLSVTKYDKANSGDDTVYFNTASTNAYQQIDFFVKTPEKTALSSAVKLTLGLGKEKEEVQGIAVFDDVAFQSITEAEYTAATENDTAHKLTYNDITSTDVSPETPSDDTKNDSSDYRWIIFTSVAFGAVLIIIVIIYIVKKVLPKRKVKADLTKKPKKGNKADTGDDNYNDLKD